MSEVDVPAGRSRNELHLRLFAQPDVRRLAAPGCRSVYGELCIYWDSGSGGAGLCDVTRNLVPVLLALPAEDFPEAIALPARMCEYIWPGRKAAGRRKAIATGDHSNSIMRWCA